MYYETGLYGVCNQNVKTILQAIVVCPLIVVLWTYVEQLLSYVGRIRQSAESIVLIAPSPSFNGASKTVFLW